MNLLRNFEAQAIIFDKDGTLIDFDAMWGGWTLQLADRLEYVSGLDIHKKLCEIYGYDMKEHKIIRDGIITYTPMWRLREILVSMVRSKGLSKIETELAVKKAWIVPDPVILAKPFTNLGVLFTNIHKMGIQIAIATTDDREPTQAMLEAMKINHLVSLMVCADDGIPAKPAPDMVSTICSRLEISPSKTIVVGDTVADMKMGRSAGAGRVVGVLSGVGSLEHLTPLADILIDSIDTLHSSFISQEAISKDLPDDGLTDLNPDLALG